MQLRHRESPDMVACTNPDIDPPQIVETPAEGTHCADSFFTQ